MSLKVAAVPAIDRRSLRLWFCPECGALVTNSNYRVDETRQRCVGKSHKALAVSRRYAPLREADGA